MAEGKFASVCSVEEFILEHENTPIPLKKLNEMYKLLERFLKRKDETRKTEDIPAEFIISIRTKDGNQYEPTSTCSVQPWSYGCTREVAKHKRSVRVARGDSQVRL